MSQILLGQYSEPDKNIKLQTSLNSDIENRQGLTILAGNVNLAQEIERSFQSTFLTSPNPIYNCHGMTFANRRTGIFNMAHLFQILADEYEHIKNQDNVKTGDIIIYYTPDEKEILHSGIVTFVDINNHYNKISILSKAGQLGEIVHYPEKVPPQYNGLIKYYRIAHRINITRLA
jgi:hypothetical protein